MGLLTDFLDFIEPLESGKLQYYKDKRADEAAAEQQQQAMMTMGLMNKHGLLQENQPILPGMPGGLLESNPVGVQSYPLGENAATGLSGGVAHPGITSAQGPGYPGAPGTPGINPLADGGLERFMLEYGAMTGPEAMKHAQTQITELEKARRQRQSEIDYMTAKERADFELDLAIAKQASSQQGREWDEKMRAEQLALMNEVQDDTTKREVGALYDVTRLHGIINDDIESNGGVMSQVGQNAAIKGINKAILAGEAVMGDDFATFMQGLNMDSLLTTEGLNHWIAQRTDKSTGLLDITGQRELMQMYDRLAADADYQLQGVAELALKRLQMRQLGLSDGMRPWRQFQPSRYAPPDVASPARNSVQSLDYGYGGVGGE